MLDSGQKKTPFLVLRNGLMANGRCVQDKEGISELTFRAVGHIILSQGLANSFAVLVTPALVPVIAWLLGLAGWFPYIGQLTGTHVSPQTHRVGQLSSKHLLYRKML